MGTALAMSRAQLLSIATCPTSPASVNDMLHCGSLSAFSKTGHKDKQARPERRQKVGSVGLASKMGRNGQKWTKNGATAGKPRKREYPGVPWIVLILLDSWDFFWISPGLSHLLWNIIPIKPKQIPNKSKQIPLKTCLSKTHSKTALAYPETPYLSQEHKTSPKEAKKRTRQVFLGLLSFCV